MDFDVASKLIFGFISALGTIALVFYNMGQSRKAKAELLEKFEEAVDRKNKHSTTEIFRLIHGLRMSYSDVIELIEHDDCSKVIYALKKTPGMVSFRNGEFQYAGMGRNKLFRWVDRWFLRATIVFFGFVAVISLAFLGFGEGATSIAGFIFLIFSSMMLALQLRQRAYDQMVQELVTPEHNNKMQPTADASAD